MGSTALAPYAIPNIGQLIETIGTAIAKSKLAGCENIDQGKVMALTCIVRNRDPLTLLETYDIIQGRLSMKADAMLAGFEGVGGEYQIKEYTPDACEIVFTRGKTTLTIRITWEDAQKEKWPFGKGNKVKDNWATPIGRQDMLWARVVSRGVRRLAPSVVCGRYTPEEIQDFPETPDEAACGKISPDHTGADSPAVAPSSVASAVSSGMDDVVDAECTVKGTEVEQQPESEAPATGSHDGPMELSVTDPMTEQQRKEVFSLIAALKQQGVSDIAQRIKKKLIDSGFGGENKDDNALGKLNVREADQLIKALQKKEIEVWATQALVGHAGVNQGNG